MPKVSIIVPVYNGESYVGKCIESILNQSYKDFELILINDGSKDGSINVLNRYKDLDNRIKVIDNKNNGVSETRNIGVKNSIGEYIQFIDSDDYVETNMLQNTVLSLEKEEADLVITGLYLDIEKDGSISSTVQTFDYCQSIGKTDIAKNVLHRLNGTYINSPVNKLYKKYIIINNNIVMDRSIDLGEDLIFNLEYLKYCNKVIFDNKAYYHYLMKVEENLTFKYREDKLELMHNLYAKTKEYLKYCKVSEVDIKELNTLFIKWIYSAFNDLHHPNCKLSLREKRRYIKSSIVKYKDIINNTTHGGSMIKILKSVMINSTITLVVSKMIYFIKIKNRKMFYKG